MTYLVKVESFSIGFGPILLHKKQSWTIYKKQLKHHFHSVLPNLWLLRTLKQYSSLASLLIMQYSKVKTVKNMAPQKKCGILHTPKIIKW